jgi:lipopolysaccharide export system permease protein
MMIGGTLNRYFALQFLTSVLAVFLGGFALVAMIDYIEIMRRTADLTDVSAWQVAKASFYRVPEVTERIMPSCVLIAAMSCFLGLSRRLELVVARAAGMSAWQIIAPPLVVAFVLGVLATTVYNPISAVLQEQSKRLETEIFGENQPSLQESLGTGFWMRQRATDGQSIIHAITSREQGVQLGGVTVFTFDNAGQFKERIEAKAAVLEPGSWRLEEARVYVTGSRADPPRTYMLSTNLTPEQVRESFATPESVPFWKLPLYIDIADRAGLGGSRYRLQYQKLLARPFLLASMVFLAAAVSLRFFRFGGIQKLVLSGIAAGFLLYVLAKVIEDLSTAGLLAPVVAAWLPVALGSLTGLITLLYQEDG